MNGPVASLAAALCLLAPLVTTAAERNKTVFISDLHMNMDVSYAWLKTNATALASFINTVNARPDVAELVILGDMLDDWVETVESSPHSFGDVLSSPNNAGIVSALRTICQNTNMTVTYVTGNHDMLSFETASKTDITNAIPGLNIISESPGLGAYTMNNVVWAEHGHRYCLFNAPDTWSRSGGHLPMGYFISRIAASKSARENKVYTTMDALDSLIKSPGSFYTPAAGQENDMFNDQFIRALFDAFALVWGGKWPWTTFTMGNVDNYASNPSVDNIGVTYDGIFSNWPGRMDTVDQYDAVLNEVGHLSSAANMLFEMPDRIRTNYPFTPRIVLFGHTHKAAFSYHCDSNNTIYANTGTWVDNSPRTWVEIEINHAGSKDFYTVSLWFYGESTPRQAATIDAPFSGAGACSAVAHDFDGDGRSEPAVVSADGAWHAWLSGSEYSRLGPFPAAGAGYTPLAADFDGDAKADPAAVSPDGEWHLWLSGLDYSRVGPLLPGYSSGTPLAADFDGDAKADPAVVDNYGNWYAWFSRSGYSRSGPYPLLIP